MQELGPTTSHIYDAKVQNVFSSIRPQSWVRSESNATGDAACTRSALVFCYPKGLLQSSVNIRNRYRMLWALSGIARKFEDHGTGLYLAGL
jgi:hypothetical protein